MAQSRIEIFQELKDGLKIENKSWDLIWGTSLFEIIELSETCQLNGNNIPWINFGKLSIFEGIELNFCTPFDTLKSNNGEKTLNHAGQNLNLEDLDKLVSSLITRLGNPDEESDTYGIYKEWRQGVNYIRIMPRSAHGSDWSSIVIGKETTYNNTYNL